jgi:hypothetical protein
MLLLNDGDDAPTSADDFAEIVAPLARTSATIERRFDQP